MIDVRHASPEHYGWIAQRAQLVVTDGFRAIEAIDSAGRIVGMVGYDGWTPNSCAMHVAIEEPIAVRRLLRPGFGIPFLELQKGVVLASVLSTNAKSLQLVSGLGFRALTRMRDAWDKGVDVLLFEMRREDCRWVR